MATTTRTRRKDADSPAEPTAAPAATEATPAETGGPEPTDTPTPAASKPTSARDRMKVTMVAEILAEYPDGIPAADLVTLSELQPAVVARVLTAMEATSAAHRKVADDGTETWYRGTGELAAVDLASAPVDSTCPTCKRPGWTVKVGGATSRRRASGNGEPGVNGDGKPKLRKGELTGMVRDFLRSRPGEGFTDGEIARELGERHARVISSGAVRENLTKMLVDKDTPVELANPDDPHDRRFTWAG
jgi:hypothetical protein